uniref:Uncharacterized protein n=1 Tax=Romanomermis culicivorax TaxID=13658 RepID=A0A915L0A9_ROMCU
MNIFLRAEVHLEKINNRPQMQTSVRKPLLKSYLRHGLSSLIYFVRTESSTQVFTTVEKPK